MNNRYCCMHGDLLPFNSDGYQEGFYCCGEYYCSQDCLDESFTASGATWHEHYSDDGECYWTEWHDDLDGVLYVPA
ncbi:hypothetical protein RhoFasB10_03289 [Rhodococcus sp. B10]|nr:hypothetical protein [Rhodococcus sp. B10]